VLNTADDVLTNPTSFSFTTKSALNAFTPSWTDNYVADVNFNADPAEEGTTFSIPADIDGDGDIDIISCNFWNYQITLHKNDGNTNPSFTSTNIGETSVASKPHTLFVADIDGDGDLDLIEGDSGDGFSQPWFIRVHSNLNGDGSSWSKDIINNGLRDETLTGQSSVFVADMDNDGDMDIIGSGWDNNRIAWYENNGAGSFSKGESITNSADQVRSIVAADMDNDGDMDIISAHEDIIAWYENDGNANPTWTKIIIAGTFDTAQAVYAADMDNDGDIDIIAVKHNGIVWFENDGNADPTFTAANVATSGPGADQYDMFGGYGPIAISVADINNDGHMDILSAKSWYINDGNANPSWTAAQFRTGTNDIRSISAADMDGDGDMDILATSYDDDKISWYENSITNTWDGSAGNAWGTGENWDTGVIPTTVAPFENIVIPGNLTNYPTAANAVVVTSVDMTSGSSLIASNTFSGEINYKRSIGSTNWQFISSPVSGQDIDAFIGAQSVAAGTDDNRGLSDYNNTTEAFTFWQAGTTNSGNFVLGDGRAIKLSETEDITFTGTLSTEKVDIAITSNTNGFNLIGNPYPSYIAANTGADAVNNLLTINDVDNDFLSEATLWFWDQSSDSYTQKNLASGAFYIAPGQGFFVSANGNHDFSFTEAMQSHQATDTFLKTRTTRPEIKLTLTNGAAVKHSEIYYIDGTTTGFDNGYDSSVFGAGNQNFSIYTHAVANSTGKKLGIQSLPNSDFESMVIPVGVNAAAGLEISFSMNHQNLPSGLMVFIEDKKLKTITRLDQENSNYKITLDADSSKIGRFYMRTSTSDLRKTLDTKNFNIEQVSIYLSSDRNLRIAGLKSDTAMLTVFNISGKQVYSQNLKSSETIDVTLSNSIIQGIYIIKLETNKGTINKKIFLK